MVSQIADAPAPIATQPSANRRAWLGLTVLALPTLLVAIDTFVLLLALPHLAVGLGDEYRAVVDT